MRDPQQLINRFRNRRQVLDGGLATELEDRGHDISGKLWSGHVLLNDPKAVEQVHYDYIAAGADIITSASYQLSPLGMIEAGYDKSQAQRVLELSVELAVKARDRCLDDGVVSDGASTPLIAASIGPYGAYLADGSEYTGDYDLDNGALYEFHQERVAVLTQTDADFIAFETVPSLSEAMVLVELGRDYGEPPIWISFSCRDGEHLSDGTKVRDAVNAVLCGRPNLIAIGVNCTAPQYVEPILRQFANTEAVPLVAYPNSGEGWDAVHRCWVGENGPIDFSEYAQRWIAAGANIIGGCCRTGPAHIRQLRELLSAGRVGGVR